MDMDINTRNSVLTLPDVFTVTGIEHIITEVCRSSWTLTCCTISFLTVFNVRFL